MDEKAQPKITRQRPSICSLEHPTTLSTRYYCLFFVVLPLLGLFSTPFRPFCSIMFFSSPGVHCSIVGGHRQFPVFNQYSLATLVSIFLASRIRIFEECLCSFFTSNFGVCRGLPVKCLVLSCISFSPSFAPVSAVDLWCSFSLALFPFCASSVPTPGFLVLPVRLSP